MGSGLAGLDHGLEGCGDVMYVCVVSPDYLCRWQVQVSVYNNNYYYYLKSNIQCT